MKDDLDAEIDPTLIALQARQAAAQQTTVVDTAGGGGGAAGPATQLEETNGPTVLDFAGIDDGDYLRRVGTNIVGDTPAGGTPSSFLGAAKWGR